MPVPSSSDVPPHPPLPPLTLRVGVTGHRPNRLTQSDPALLAAQIDLVLRRIQDAANEAAADWPSTQPAVCRVVSSLAEGADRLVARAALACGFAIQVVLPLPQADYEQDFEARGSLAEFRDLLQRAENVFELPAASPRAQAYLAAGELTLRQCDVLLAIWDGAPSAGLGGTAEIAAQAAAAGLPVVRIHAIAPHPIYFGTGTEPLAELSSALRSLLLPQPPALASLQAYRRERWPGRPAASSFIFLRVLGDRQLRLPSTPRYEAIASEVHSPSLRPYFAWADALATRHGERSRSAALQLQWLASAAVFSGLLAIPLEEHRWALRLLACTECGATLVLVATALLLLRRPWHARWLLYRSLAEQMRSLDLLAPLGEPLSYAQVPGFFHHESGSEAFSQVFLQAVTRHLGFPSARVDPAFLNQRSEALAHTLESQAAFQGRAARRYENIERVLRRAGLVLFITAAIFSLYDLAHSFLLTEFVSPWLTAGTALLPAVGAMITGLATQGEYQRLTHRAVAMRRTLAVLLAELPRGPSLTLESLVAATHRAAEVLTSEVRDWQVLVSVKRPSLPT